MPGVRDRGSPDRGARPGSIPEGVKEDDIAATYTEGVLEIVLPGAAPKEDLEKPAPTVKTIPIKTVKAA